MTGRRRKWYTGRHCPYGAFCGGVGGEGASRKGPDLRVGRRIGIGMAGAFGLLLWAGLSGAGAQERLREEALNGRWLFTPGRVEVGAQVGGGFSMQNGIRDASLFTLLPRVGYVVVQQEAILPGSLEIVGEPGYFTVFEGRTAHAWGLAALIKYNVWTGTRLTPFLEGGAGVSYATIRVPRRGTNFNFTPQAGIGFHYAVGERSTLDFEWRYHHFSNAGISDANPGINISSFLLGLSLLY